jgi:hypothetical protein
VDDGLELVRVGRPMRPELAAWRYGDQFGRRRRRQYYMLGGAAVLVGTVVVAGPMLGLAGAGVFSPAWNILNGATQIYRSQKLIAVPSPGAEPLRTRLSDVGRVKLEMDGDVLHLSVPVVSRSRGGAWWRYARMRETRVLSGDDAVRAAGARLPLLNQRGGNESQVRTAVDIVEAAGSPAQLFSRAARDLMAHDTEAFGKRRKSSLKRVPLATRLALEMASHEESERRALEGELAVLEEAWQQADEVAAIADDMFLPASVDADLARLKRVRLDQARPPD